MSKKQRVEAEDLVELYDLVWSQFKEDREAAKTIYEDLKAHLKNDPHMYEDCGDTLAKYADLMIKQTGQVVELIKLASKKHQADGSLSEDDLQAIEEEIAKK